MEMMVIFIGLPSVTALLLCVVHGKQFFFLKKGFVLLEFKPLLNSVVVTTGQSALT